MLVSTAFNSSGELGCDEGLLMLGMVVTHVKFETGSDELRALEQKIYVASGRFIIEEGKPLVVEYKISQVTA